MKKLSILLIIIPLLSCAPGSRTGETLGTLTGIVAGAIMTNKYLLWVVSFVLLILTKLIIMRPALFVLVPSFKWTALHVVNRLFGLATP